MATKTEKKPELTPEEAERIAGFIEHSWSRDPDDDPFARIN